MQPSLQQPELSNRKIVSVRGASSGFSLLLALDHEFKPLNIQNFSSGTTVFARASVRANTQTSL